MRYRIEEDSLGKVKVPAEAYYGAHTVRAIETFGTRQPFPNNFIRAYALVKQAAALANMGTRRLDGKKGHAIVRACGEIANGKLADQFPVSVFQQGAGTSTNMNMNEVIANRAIELLGGRRGEYSLVNPNDDVNMAQSTNDTFHATMHVAALLLITKSLLPALMSLEKSLDKKAKQFSRIVKSGRTHLQYAVPLTLGQEFGGYTATVRKNIERIKAAADSLLEINLGGTAVGTGLNAEPKYQREVIRQLSRLTKLKFRPAKNMFASTANMNAVVQMSATLRTLAVSLIKISNDLRLLSSSDIGEIILPPVGAGSSIMPGKVNPSVPEMVGMAGFHAVGNDTAIALAGQAGQLELNIFMPVAAYNLLNSIEALSHAASIFDRNCVRGIRAVEQKIKEHLERNPAIVTALSPYIGYKKAAEVARKAGESGKSIRQVCIEMNLMSGKELDNVLDLRKLTKPGVAKRGK